MTLGIFFREYILVFEARGEKEYSNLKEEKNVFIAKQANKKTSIFILPEKETRSYRKGIQGMVRGLPASAPPENMLQMLKS